MKEANRQNKQMLLLFLKISSLGEIGHSESNLAAKMADPYNFKFAPEIFEQFFTVKEGKSERKIIFLVFEKSWVITGRNRPFRAPFVDLFEKNVPSVYFSRRFVAATDRGSITLLNIIWNMPK